MFSFLSLVRAATARELVHVAQTRVLSGSEISAAAEGIIKFCDQAESTPPGSETDGYLTRLWLLLAWVPEEEGMADVAQKIRHAIGARIGLGDIV